MILEKPLFIRKSQLIVGPKISGTEIPTESPLGRLFNNRVVFNVKMTSESKSNEATISVYNLSQDSRSFLEQLVPDDNKRARGTVFLSAGYRGLPDTLSGRFSTDIGEIFAGDLIQIGSKREGPDIVTILYCLSGGTIARQAHVEIALDSGATNTQVILLAAAALKLAVGTQIGWIPKVYENGYNFSGKATECIDELTEELGLEWSHNNGEIQILPPGTPTPETALVVSADTGLIGYPSKTDQGIKFQSLMNHRFRPGRAVQVNSKQFQTILGGKINEIASASLVESGEITKIKTAEFSGDTLGGDWYVNIESVPVDLFAVLGVPPLPSVPRNVEIA